jgi:hypothetical protein
MTKGWYSASKSFGGETNMSDKAICMQETTCLTPEQYIAGLTDFGPGRATLFSNSTDDYLKVHQLAASTADVTEGSGGIWERLLYDWSNPNNVVLITIDSNTWGGASGHTYTFTRRPDGKTEIALSTVREGKNFKGKLLGFILRTVGKSVLVKAFQNSIKAMETRHGSVAAGSRLAEDCGSKSPALV